MKYRSNPFRPPDIFDSKCQDIVSGTALFVEIEAEDLAVDEGDFVEGEFEAGDGAGGGAAKAGGAAWEDLFFVGQAAFGALL